MTPAARIASVLVCGLLGGCAEVVPPLAGLFLATMIDGAVAHNGARVALRVHLVKAELVDGLPPGAELSARRCHQACDSAEERCWHLNAHVEPLTSARRRPVVVCAEGTPKPISEDAFNELEPLARGAQLPQQRCDAYCAAESGDATATCKLQRVREEAVEMLAADERLVLCLPRE